MLDLVDQDGQATVVELAKRFSICAVTVRGDLDALASIGAVVRSHGGAVRRLEESQDYPLRTKETLHREEKIRIGRAAAELIQAGETIILDSGTTTAQIARHLKVAKIQSVTVITNALNIAAELKGAPGISLIMNRWAAAPSFLLFRRSASRSYDERVPRGPSFSRCGWL